MIRVGLLGCGGIGTRHITALKTMPERAELVACCGRDLERTEDFARLHGGTAYADFDAMLAAEHLDLVIVALPPFAHDGQVEAAAMAGVHLLVEKPIALDMERARAQVAATEAAGVVAACAFMYRFGEAVEAWDLAAAEGRTGQPGLFTGHFHCNALHAQWWRERALSGGQTVEQLIHIVDLGRHMLGRPASVYARMANLFHQDVPRYDTEDVSAMILGYEDGRIGVINASNGAVPGRWSKGWTMIAGSMTGVFSDFNAAELVATVEGKGVARTIAGERDVFAAQLADVLDAIATERAPKVPLREGAESLEIVLAARASAESGREVRL
jgi:predicted dehydrogenase